MPPPRARAHSRARVHARALCTLCRPSYMALHTFPPRALQFVWYLLWTNVLVAWAFLLSTLFRSSKTAVVFSFLYVFGTGGSLRSSGARAWGGEAYAAMVHRSARAAKIDRAPGRPMRLAPELACLDRRAS